MCYYFFMILAKWFFKIWNFDECLIRQIQGYAFTCMYNSVHVYYKGRNKLIYAIWKNQFWKYENHRCWRHAREWMRMRHHVRRHQVLCLWWRSCAVVRQAQVLLFSSSSSFDNLIHIVDHETSLGVTTLIAKHQQYLATATANITTAVINFHDWLLNYKRAVFAILEITTSYYYNGTRSFKTRVILIIHDWFFCIFNFRWP